MQMLELEQELTFEPNFNEGEKIRIVCGPLEGREGILVNHQSKTRFSLHLQEINQAVFVEISMSMVTNMN